MEEKTKARDQAEQAVMARRLWEPSHGGWREDWPDPRTEPCQPAQDELDLLQGKVSGHRWDSWHRLTGDEGYFAACSCGWRSTEADCVSLMLRQVKEHLDAVRAVRGGRPSARPARDERERDAGRREMRPDERTRELYASVQNQQRRLFQALEHSADLLSVSQEQAERFVVVLEHAAAKVAPEWARTRAAVQSAEDLQRQVERVKEWRNEIVATAGALAAIAQEVALAGQGLETRYPSGTAGYRPLADIPANRTGTERVWQDDLHLAHGLGRAAD
jgi:hypothetical protein